MPVIRLVANTYIYFSEPHPSEIFVFLLNLHCTCTTFQAKGKERQWLKNQTYGDLDDAKLIDGLTGEKSVYKRRGEKEPEVNMGIVYVSLTEKFCY